MVCPGVFGIVASRSVAGSATSSWSAARSDLKPSTVSANCSGVAVASRAGQYSSGQLGARYARSPDVVEDVRLGDPDVLEQVPGRVGDVGRQPVDGVVREVRHGGVERQVGTVPVDEREELLAQDVAGGHLVPRFGGLVGAWPGR